MQRHAEIAALLISAFAAANLLALFAFDPSATQKNVLGTIGHFAGWFWYLAFGLAAFPLLICQLAIGLRGLVIDDQRLRTRLIASVGLGAALSLLFTVIAAIEPACEHLTFLSGDVRFPFKLGGLPCYLVFHHVPMLSLKHLLNVTGSGLLAIVGILISLSFVADVSIRVTLLRLRDGVRCWRERRKIRVTAFDHDEDERRKIQGPVKMKQLVLDAKRDSHPKMVEPAVEMAQIVEPVDHCYDPLQAPLPKKASLANKPPISAISEEANATAYVLPSIDLLNLAKRAEQATMKQELKEKADLLEETLMSFGIEAKVGQIHSGPTITCFEVHPAVGVKIGRIKTLEQDIALNLEAKSLRIIAPIPGKACVGIEVPNKHPQEVSFRELLSSYLQQGASLRIPMLLGKSVSGEFVFCDLTRLPHCIIAGATGSGKSVCINSVVMSLLMVARPDEIRLLMIDPKKVELTPYTALPHMLAPVITEPHDACVALNWLVKEMEKRYEILKLTGQRHIDGFNRRKPAPTDASQPIPIPATMPYYVAIIDELADLMMASTQDIETPIARLAQMARAVGIHLIVATQRPSREVITGLIRANFPARIAFKVASRVNSQIILDEVGAETLLGNGDMLLLLPGASQLIRAQGAFVRDEEIAKVIAHSEKQGPTKYVISSFAQMAGDSFSQADDEHDDELYEEAKNIVLSTGTASTTFLQRKLKVGYARAASLMDLLEARNIVSPPEGPNKTRKVYLPKNNAPGASAIDELLS